MKKSNPVQESIKDVIREIEKQIRLDERKRTLAKFSKRLRECYEFASKIMQRMAAFAPPTELAEPAAQRMDGDDPSLPDKPAPQRKAVTATAEQIGAALHLLCSVVPRYTPLTAANIAEAWDCEGGKRSAGAALRALVADGRAVVKRGKYAQAQPADGAQA